MLLISTLQRNILQIHPIGCSVREEILELFFLPGLFNRRKLEEQVPRKGLGAAGLESTSIMGRGYRTAVEHTTPNPGVVGSHPAEC